MARRSCASSSSKDSSEQMQAWSSENRWKINEFPGSINQFLDVFLPGHKTSKLPRDTCYGVFSGLKHAESFSDVEFRTALIENLQRLVRKFPGDKQPIFRDTDSTSLSFPGPATCSDSPADISVLSPGVELGNHLPTWQDVTLVFEAKSSQIADPMRKSKDELATPTQLETNARNLMSAHGALSCFVVGVYGANMRFFYFDHAGAVASPPLDYRARPEIVRRFLWGFVHPAAGLSVVGADDTSSVPSQIYLDDVWDSRLDRMADQAKPTTSHSRLLTVPLPDGTEEQLTTTRVLGCTSTLFSRATLVREALDRNHKSVVAKEAWRKSSHRFEMEFYLAMNKYFEETGIVRWGLPRMVCGADLGELELLSSTRTAGTRSTRSAKEWPALTQHRTVSAFYRDIAPVKSQALERSHTRLVTDLVGRPLSEFRSTHELVHAIRDALKGHQQAYDIEILHRDVSEGNIMIVDGQPFHGFIHDFDYSSFFSEAKDELRRLDDLEARRIAARTKRSKRIRSSQVDGHSEANHSGDGQPAPPLSEAAQAVIDDLKETTGTVPFMAIELLDLSEDQKVVHRAHHDLESFYWVLVWIIVRHTEHDHPRGADTCQSVFGDEDEKHSKAMKTLWLAKVDCKVLSNKPLSSLHASLQKLVKNSHSGEAMLTHEVMLREFDRALAMPNWPANDKAIPFIPTRAAEIVAMMKEEDEGLPEVGGRKRKMPEEKLAASLADRPSAAKRKRV